MEMPILDELAQKAFDDRIKIAVEEAEEKACKEARNSLLAAVREAFLDGVNIGCFVKYHNLTSDEIDLVTETEWPTAPVLRKVVVLTETKIPILDVLAQKSFEDRIRKVEEGARKAQADRQATLAVLREVARGAKFDDALEIIPLTPEELDFVKGK
ncbi:MAG: hypothetical protein LBT59_01070 [Clostridiales bacterium]|jgi:hypothetical protein|nr:hypothetical protein [Clostridiales bacterium]